MKLGSKVNFDSDMGLTAFGENIWNIVFQVHYLKYCFPGPLETLFRLYQMIFYQHFPPSFPFCLKRQKQTDTKH